jgi:pSer/pThr/pTyr-binding forkhead associated (FHA) protein
MKVKLRVLQGKLQNRRGANVGTEINIRRARFVIGAGDDCNMRCRSRWISDRHCELRISEGQLEVHDLGSEAGTFVNNQRVEGAVPLADKDQLRVGRLEFEVVIRVPEDAATHVDPMADFVSELLVEADQEDQARRMEDPRTRHFVVEKVEAQATSQGDETKAAKPFKRPPKKAPGKLPPPPEYVADNTIEAAQETLKKIFDKPKK